DGRRGRRDRGAARGARGAGLRRGPGLPPRPPADAGGGRGAPGHRAGTDLLVISAAGSFLRRAAAGAVSSLPAQNGVRQGEFCIAVAVRDDVRPLDQPFVDELLAGVVPGFDAAASPLAATVGP